MVNASRNAVAVLGIPVHNVTMEEAIAAIEELIRAGGFHQVAAANLDSLTEALENEGYRDLLCNCSLVVPDGMPLVRLSRLFGPGLKQRVSTIDLVARLADLSARRGYGIFLLGANEISAQRAARALKQRHPDLRIVGRYSPPSSALDKMDHDPILSRIEQADPDILFVALGHPMQEQWIAMHRERLKVPVCLGVGSSLDGLFDSAARANEDSRPTHRYLPGPFVASRYLRGTLCLLRNLPGYLAAIAMQPRKPARPGVPISSIKASRQIGNTRLIAAFGDLTDANLQEFSDLSESACREGMNVIVDMSETSYCGPEFIGSLIQLEAKMRNRNEQLWLTRVPGHLARILRTSRLQNYFRTTKIVSDALYRTAKAEQRLLASFTPPPGRFQEEQLQIDVRMELMQGVCQQILSAPSPHQA